METINGVSVSEDMIQAWADEAERGYDVETLRCWVREPEGGGLGRVAPVEAGGVSRTVA